MSPKADLFPESDPHLIYRQLKGAHPHLTAYLKDSVPEDLHYRKHRRIPPVFAVADDGWTITSRKTFKENPLSYLGGTHGYHPSNESMWSIFMARGPSFRPGTALAPFSNVNVYALLCHLLDLKPAANSGSLEPFRAILTE